MIEPAFNGTVGSMPMDDLYPVNSAALHDDESDTADTLNDPDGRQNLFGVDKTWALHRTVENPVHDKSHTAWKCGRCGYYMMAMDHRGVALPLELNAFGEPIPTYCPRCDEAHVDWSMENPRSQFGDFPNIPGGFAANVTHGVPQPRARNEASALVLPGSDRPAGMELGMRTAATATVASPKKKGPMAYYCGRCDRRLMRLDSHGALIPIETDAFGNIVPLFCPGCKEEHSEWIQGPMHRPPTKK